MNDQRFEIEPDVPIPEGTTKQKYPFSRMNVGDSFVFEKEQLTALRNSSASWAKRHGGKFVCRQVGTDVWRCWRIE